MLVQCIILITHYQSSGQWNTDLAGEIINQYLQAWYKNLYSDCNLDLAELGVNFADDHDTVPCPRNGPDSGIDDGLREDFKGGKTVQHKPYAVQNGVQTKNGPNRREQFYPGGAGTHIIFILLSYSDYRRIMAISFEPRLALEDTTSSSPPLPCFFPPFDIFTSPAPVGTALPYVIEG
uniref:Uncharacterized protein n=1 Tax=Cannabis sativa TaxID=3483 RepID=A0A803PV03_CANSA